MLIPSRLWRDGFFLYLSSCNCFVAVTTSNCHSYVKTKITLTTSYIFFTSAPGYKLLEQSELGIVNISSGESSRIIGIWTDQFQATDRCLMIGNYYLDQQSYDGLWTNFYLEGCKNSELAIETAMVNDHILELGVAKIMHAIYFGEAAALWGDIPCRQAIDISNNSNPKFDDQKQVFDDVQQLLTEAIKHLENAFVDNAYGSPVFVPNEASWVEIAHSLKARYYLISKNYEKALAEAKLGISSAEGSLLSFHKDEPGSKNLYYQFMVEQRGGAIGPDDSHLVKLMTGEIPRELKSPGDSLRFDYYFEIMSSRLELNTNPGGIFAADASFPIISWTETLLIKAEASLRTGIGNPLIPFNQVRDHLNQIYGSGFPHSSTSGDKLLKQILEEKYISLFGSLQTFHDLRRTKNYLKIPFLGVPDRIYHERFLYPQIEMNTNSNFPGLVDLFEPTPVNK